ncbi:unnamed protein product [Meloidogyne enterolobii]|uniref:Uncharacterized protein n=1 Tax=Meloidogyne enterolobii TaxID=390850 RepID=A0ACB0ZUN3_MELEN
MGAEFEKLLEDFSFGNEFICSSDNIRYLSRFLPRPPIFSIPLEEDNLNLFSNKNSLEKNQESLSWLRLHRCYLIISMAFGISNRMENLIGFSALWMAQSQENSNKNNKINEFTNNSSNDLSIILEKQLFIGHSENEIYTDLNIFQTLFSVVIGMQIRELLIKSIKNNDFELINKYKIKLEVLSFPFKNASQEPKENELIWKSIKRNFPPLNELNRPNWYLLILSGAEEKFNLNELTELNKNNLQIFPSENYRFRLNNFEDILIMQYLSSEFPIVNLPPSLIQMRLELVPDEFCSCNRRSFVSKNLNKNTKNNIIESFDEIGRKFSFKINENNLIKEENICKKEEIDELEILAEEIRSGIKRLELLEEETNLINGKKMGNLQAIEGINEINRSVKQQKNIRPKHQLKPNKKLSKITKIKRQSITQSDLERKQKTYSAFLSFLLKQKGIEGSEELTTTTEPLKSSSEINNNYYSTNNSVDSSESRSSLNSNKGRRKNKKINYSSKLNEEEESSTSNWASEEEEEEKNIFEKELTKEQLLQEMNKVGKHLEWIWAQIGGRINEENVDGEDYDNEEVEEGEDKQKEEEILERKENSYDQKLLELENEEYFKENKEGKEEILQQEPNEQKFSSEEEFPNNNIEIKQFKMPEIRIKSNVDFSIPSLIEEEKSYELRELEEIEEIELNSNNISFKAGEIKPASGQLSSSSGYHPHHSSCSSSENSARKNESLINKSFQNWSIPPNIQPMDFSRLDIDSDEEKNSGGKTINKWTDIEVYPREILKEKTPIIINEKMQTSNQQKTPLKNKWRPPSWLRLLPPFDGTIRTERISCGKITAERQLLQLNLDRGHQRTFLDIAAKNKESLKRLKKKEKAEEINKVKTNEEIKEEQSKQNFPEQSSIYDSGIALDQTANTSRYQQDFLLYSIELCEEEIEIMRQMAKQT